MYSSVYFVIVLIKKLSLIFKKIVVLYIRHKQYEKRNGKGYEYHDLPNCNGNERHDSTKSKKHRHDKMYQPFVLKKSDMFFVIIKELCKVAVFIIKTACNKTAVTLEIFRHDITYSSINSASCISRSRSLVLYEFFFLRAARSCSFFLTSFATVISIILSIVL